MILQIGDYICACETQQFFKEHQFIATEMTGKELNDQIDDEPSLVLILCIQNAGY